MMGFGSPKSLKIASIIRRTGGKCRIASRTPCGTMSNIRESIRIAKRGACAACAKMFSASPARYGFGSVR